MVWKKSRVWYIELFFEFQSLDEKIRSDFWLPNPPIHLPASETESNIVEQLDVYLQWIYSEKSIRQSVLFADFLSINWDGKDIRFLYDIVGFLQMLLVARVPSFMPEPPRIEKDAFVAAGNIMDQCILELIVQHWDHQ